MCVECCVAANFHFHSGSLPMYYYVQSTSKRSDLRQRKNIISKIFIYTKHLLLHATWIVFC